MRFASGLPHARICQGKSRWGRRGSFTWSKAASRGLPPERPIDYARTEPRRGRMRDPGDVSLSGNFSAEARDFNKVLSHNGISKSLFHIVI